MQNGIFNIILIFATGLFGSQALAWQTLDRFGANPGDLDAFYSETENSDALLVVLHGCTQQAQQFAEESGLLRSAVANKMDVLAPQQRASNNLKSCFSWFSAPDQIGGESASIINMIAQLRQQKNYQRVYLVGLSAGGAMASNLAVTHPTMFSGVAVVAGIPAFCADSLVGAISCMKSGPADNWPGERFEAVTELPNLIVVSGTADAVVSPRNSRVLAEHWRHFKGLSDETQHKMDSEQVSMTVWQDDEQRVDWWQLADFPHAWSVASDEQVKDPYIQVGPMDLSRRLLAVWRSAK